MPKSDIGVAPASPTDEPPQTIEAGASMPPLTRRFVIGGTLAASSAAAKSLPSRPSDTSRQCQTWLAVSAELDRLTLAWQDEECRLVKLPGWFAMSEAAQRGLPDALTLFELGDQIQRLIPQRWALLEHIEQLPARDFHDVAAKLTVATRVIALEEPQGHQLLVAAMSEFGQHPCPHCGGSLLRKG